VFWLNKISGGFYHLKWVFSLKNEEQLIWVVFTT